MHIDGACHCGRIRFTAEVDPERVIACHCTDCQVLSGSPYRVVVPAPVASFVLEGEPRQYVKTADSGARRAQVFCPECATPLYGVAPEGGTHVMIRTGCVRQRAALPPKVQIWRHSALPWFDGVGDLPVADPARPAASPPPRPRS